MNLNCSYSSQDIKPPAVYIAASAVMGFCFVLGVPGNVAALWILVQQLKKGNITIKLMLSLSISDLLTLLPLPLWIWGLLHGWIFSSTACKIISFFEYWGFYCGAFFVILMSLQRYMQVMHPQKCGKLGSRGQNAFLCGTRFLSGVLCAYAPVQYDVECGQHGFPICDQQFNSDTERVATLLYEGLLLAMFFFLLVLFYFLLYRGVNQSPFFSCNRMAMLMMRIVVAFFIFNFLIPIANVVCIVKISQVTDNLNLMARVLTFLNSCVNPFLYAFALREQQSNSPLVESP